jgi:membrane protein implicated in regulation of membrane protease activity
MALLLSILLAVFVLPAPWNAIVVVVGGLFEIVEAMVFIRWSRRRRAAVGVETLVGAEAEVVDAHYVRVAGELWRARGLGDRVPGDRVRIRAVDGLELDVE